MAGIPQKLTDEWKARLTKVALCISDLVAMSPCL